ncbi:hypothetical protein H5410_055159 [Solanum commersonii]|uniref:Inosine/uridine-preferring nucleoside hydrolase domain-containing protein n=1 Tax=Solanum commersonii TaxID=4109 RepID=A0A9J5WGU9_SOLCO|nr:hypothetical protein H5410_055159 [Solanum commersonii]
MTILMAFQTPEVEVISLATIFGNVTTKDATRNTLLLAVKRDSTFASKVKRVVVLGDSFFALGKVNPAAEANVGDFFPNGIYGDPVADDVVFTWGANIDVVGINITTQVKLKDADLEELKQSKGKHTKFVCDMCKFYCDWHVKFSRCL